MFVLVLRYSVIMQAARVLMRSSSRASSLLSQRTTFTATSSQRFPSLFAPLSIRRFASKPPPPSSSTPASATNSAPASQTVTPHPNPFQFSPAHETNTSTSAPTTVQSHSSGAGETAKNSHPSGAASHADVDPYERLPDSEPYQANWVDFRPNLVEVTVTRNEEGDLVGEWEGEEVIFPDLETSLEWVLTTPVDTHLFEEVPIIKECPDTEQLH